jgi:hypothetical protein
MSYRNAAQLQIMNNTEASLSKIWSTVENVWNDMSSSEVARAIVLTYRIMRPIIQKNGNNAWLANGTPHSHVRKDYVDTTTGISLHFVDL